MKIMKNIANLVPPATCVYHKPPPYYDPLAGGDEEDYYSTNPTIFGRILNGEAPSRNYAESLDLLAFRDRTPKSEFHALVIPKRYIPNVYSLSTTADDVDDDANLVREMRVMGLGLLQEHQPTAFAKEDYILCFHIPPFNSVNHLHLHVLAPASKMTWFHRHGKYKCGMRWCMSDLDVIDHLDRGLVSVPYSKIFC